MRRILLGITLTAFLFSCGRIDTASTNSEPNSPQPDLTQLSTAKTNTTRPTPGCPAKSYCFFEHAGFNTEIFTGSNTSGNIYPSDALSSVINNSGKRVCLYDNGWLFLTIDPYQDMSYVGDDKNDRADSWKSTTGSICPIFG